MSEHLDDNIRKLLRAAPEPEASRPGAQQRIFQEVLKRLENPAPAQTPRLSWWWGAPLSALAAAAIAFCIFSGLHTVSTPPEIEPPLVQSSYPAQRLRPASGSAQSIKLADGSKLALAGGSDLEISAHAAPQRPALFLHAGSVECDVAKGQGLFSVKTPAGEATALGTRFTVSLKTPVEALREGLLKTACRRGVVMHVSVASGEVAARDLSGASQLLCGGGSAVFIKQAPESLPTSPQLTAVLQPGLDAEVLEMRKHNVKISVTEQVAFVEVEQVFYNPTQRRLEGTYEFPLPHSATICRLALSVGDELMEAEIVDSTRARVVFEQLIREQLDPALLEWTGGNLFRMRVFPIEPQGEKRILISYYDVLPKEHNRISLRYPLMAPAGQTKPIEEVSVSVTVNSSTKIISTGTPDLASKLQHKDKSVEVVYATSKAIPDKDFRLEYSLAAQTSEVSSVSYWHALRNEGYFMLLLSPQLLEAASEKVRGHEFVFVLDKSGGLGASHLALGVKTVKSALSRLRPEDNFGIIAYDTLAQTFTPKLQPASAEHVAAAEIWLDKLQAFGGSDLSQAWPSLAGLVQQPHTQVIYVGSGRSVVGSKKPDTQIALAERILKDKEIRLHCLSLGRAQDLAVLHGLSLKFNGSLRTINDGDDAVAIPSQLLADCEWPLYRNLQLSFEGVAAHSIYPARLPNLSAGRQLFVFGRYDTPGAGKLKLTGLCEDDPFSKEFDLELGTPTQHVFVARLWAQRQIEELQRQAATSSGQDRQLINRIVESSKRFRVLSQFTSFLVLESPEDYERFGIERRLDEFSGKLAEELFEVDDLMKTMEDFPARDQDDWAALPSESLSRTGKDLKSTELMYLSTGVGLGGNSYGSRSGGGRKLMVKRFGGSARKGDEYEDSVSWARENIFPIYSAPELPQWDENWQPGDAKALEILRSLSGQVQSFSARIAYCGLNEKGEETLEAEDRLAFDKASGAFALSRHKADHDTLSDGQRCAQRFPRLKYAARRKVTAHDIPAVAAELPGFVLPWVDRLNCDYQLSLEKSGEGLCLRLKARRGSQVMLIHLSGPDGPVLKVESFTEKDGKLSLVQTMVTEEFTKAGALQFPSVWRVTDHPQNPKDKPVSTVIRLLDLRLNQALEAAQFKITLPKDWAVRDMAPKPPLLKPLPPPQPIRGGQRR